MNRTQAMWLLLNLVVALTTIAILAIEHYNWANP